MSERTFPYCPVSQQLCQDGKVYANQETEQDLVYCAFWHHREKRCVFRMVEFDLFNIARSLDEIRTR